MNYTQNLQLSGWRNWRCHVTRGHIDDNLCIRRFSLCTQYSAI